MRNLFKVCESKPLYGCLGSKLPEAYQFTIPKAKLPLYVLGPYTIVCGGCDRIQPFDLIIELIQKYAALGHVLFEGALIGCIYGRTGTLMEAYGREGIFMVLDTPMEECIRRVQGRRSERGDDRELNPRNLKDKYLQLVSAVKRVEKDDILRVVRVSDTNAVDTIIKMVREAKPHATQTAVRPTDLLGGRKKTLKDEVGLW